MAAIVAFIPRDYSASMSVGERFNLAGLVGDPKKPFGESAGSASKERNREGFMGGSRWIKIGFLIC